MYFLFIILAILMFSFLIAIHELGHFVTAKLCGVKVNEFSMFMGPAIWQKQKGETLYSIRTIPFGGYCAMEGEDGESDDPRAFGKAAWWKKILILVAGAAMNFLAGFVLCLVMLTCLYSRVDSLVTTSVESFTPGNVVEGPSGLQVGDQLYALDGERIYVTGDFTNLASINLRNEGNIHDLVVIRNGQKVLLDDFNLEPRELPDEDGTLQLRYGINMATAPKNLGTILNQAWGETIGYARLVKLSLLMLFRGQASVSEVSGPVGIVKTIADVGTSSGSLRSGLINVLNFAALIAVNLAVMNLLPIPALDGGHVVTVVLTEVYETLTGKKLNPKYESYLHAAGMVLLLGIMALVFLKDAISLFR